MADNVTVDTITGSPVVASDDIAGAQYQRVKVTLGANGTNDGDVSSANPLPISDAGGSLTVDGTVGVSGSVAVTGSFYQATQPVSGTVAVSNNTFPVTDNGGSLTVDGTVAATQSGSWSIASSALPTGAATEAKQDSIITALGVINDVHQTEDGVYTTGQALSMAGGVRRDVDTTPVSGDGDVHPLIFDEIGRLKVSTYPASAPTTTGNITANGQSVSFDCSRYSNLTIHCTGTFSTVNCTFEGSIDGGTTWFATQGVRTNANTIELTTGNLSATPAYAWELSVNALTNFRVRATAFTSGTQTWRFSPGTYATEPIPAVQTHAVTGSGTFTVSGTVAATMAANATTTPAKAQDGAAGATDTGIPALFVRRDNPTALTPIAGDYAFGQISSTGELYVAPGARTTGGQTIFRSVDVDETKAQVKASAGSLTYVEACNLTAATLYLHVYDALSASVTVGTTTPTMTYVLPSNGTAQCRELNFGLPGAAFATGITLAVTTTLGGTTGPATNGCFVNALYK